MTDEVLKTLEQYESYLHTAVYSNYVRTLPRKDAEILAAIYIKQGHPKPNLSCSKCVLTMCQRLGRAYFSQKEE